MQERSRNSTDPDGMGRRQKIISDLQGKPVEDEMLVDVLWMAMDQGTRTHVSSKLDASTEISFQVMKEAVMRHTTLVGATSGAPGNRSTP